MPAAKGLNYEDRQIRARYIWGGAMALVCLAGVFVWGKYSGLIMHRMWGQSDLRYTVETRIAGPGDAAPMPTSRVTYYYTRGARRVETEYLTKPALPGLTVITRCPEQTKYTVNERQSIYYKETFELGEERGTDGDLPPVFGAATPKTRLAARARPAQADMGCCSLPRFQVPEPTEFRAPVRLAQAAGESSTRVGMIKRVYTVEELGRDTIADVPTVHYRLTSRITTGGCAGKSDVSQKMEVWVAPSLWAEFACASPTPTPTPSPAPPTTSARPGGGPPPAAAPGLVPTPYAVPTPAYAPRPTSTPTPTPTPRPEPACEIDVQQEGNVADFADAFRSLVMRLKRYDGDRVVFEQEVTQLSQKQLFADQFRVQDCKLVSREEFREKTMGATIKAWSTEDGVPASGQQ